MTLLLHGLELFQIEFAKPFGSIPHSFQSQKTYSRINFDPLELQGLSLSFVIRITRINSLGFLGFPIIYYGKVAGKYCFGK